MAFDCGSSFHLIKKKLSISISVLSQTNPKVLVSVHVLCSNHAMIDLVCFFFVQSYLEHIVHSSLFQFSHRCCEEHNVLPDHREHA